MEEREYARTAAVEDGHWWFCELRAVWRGLLRHAERRGGRPLAGGRILDAGCGTGGNLRALEPLGRCVGLDVSPEALRLAAARVKSPLVRGSLLALPFRDGVFDVALCADVLYHRAVPDDVAALGEVRRVLRPGGWLLVNVPAFDSLRSAHDRAVHGARRYRRGGLRERLAAAGLRPVRVAYWNALLLGPAVVWRRLARSRGETSDLSPPPGPVNALLRGLSRLDAAVALRGVFPAGLSIAALARREADPAP